MPGTTNYLLNTNFIAFQQIDEIGIKSSFINSDLTKLITLFIKDVRIKKGISSNNYDSIVKECPEKTKKTLDFRDAKVPHFINIFAQVRVIQINSSHFLLLY